MSENKVSKKTNPGNNSQNAEPSDPYAEPAYPYDTEIAYPDSDQHPDKSRPL